MMKTIKVLFIVLIYLFCLQKQGICSHAEWDASPDNVAGYYLYWAEQSVVSHPVGMANVVDVGNVLRYPEEGKSLEEELNLIGGIGYYIVLKAYRGGLVSIFSEEVYFTASGVESTSIESSSTTSTVGCTSSTTVAGTTVSTSSTTSSVEPLSCSFCHADPSTTTSYNILETTSVLSTTTTMRWKLTVRSTISSTVRPLFTVPDRAKFIPKVRFNTTSVRPKFIPTVRPLHTTSVRGD